MARQYRVSVSDEMYLSITILWTNHEVIYIRGSFAGVWPVKDFLSLAVPDIDVITQRTLRFFLFSAFSLNPCLAHTKQGHAVQAVSTTYI